MLPFRLPTTVSRVYCYALSLLKLSKTQLNETQVNGVNISVTCIFRNATNATQYLQLQTTEL